MLEVKLLRYGGWKPLKLQYNAQQEQLVPVQLPELYINIIYIYRVPIKKSSFFSGPATSALVARPLPPPFLLVAGPLSVSLENVYGKSK